MIYMTSTIACLSLKKLNFQLPKVYSVTLYAHIPLNSKFSKLVAMVTIYLIKRS